MDFNQNMTPFALAPVDVGYQNQILGAFKALYDMNGTAYNSDDLFLLPDKAKTLSDVKHEIVYSQFATYNDFFEKITALLDEYLLHVKSIPNVFITVYNPTESNQPAGNADTLCRAIKEYYAQHNLGPIFTVVLSSRFHKYKYVDLINVPKHLMTFSARIRLIRNHKLGKKILSTIGIIHSFSIDSVRKKRLELDNNLSNLKNDADLKDVIAKINAYKKRTKKIVFCLGGRVQGPEINFNVHYAQKLFTDATVLAAQGFGVAFVNGPRTPNDVTDYLYEQSLENPQILFYNCKKIAQTDEDRTHDSWRIYSGKHEESFRKMQKLGNIYQGLLGYKNTLVVHTMDTYASCETTSAGIPTAISSNGLYIDPVVRYDCINLFQLLCPKYAINFDEFVNITCNMKIEPQDLRPRVLSNPLRVFAETVSKHLKAFNASK